MKKSLLTLAALALAPVLASAQSASGSWGTAVGFGGGLFDNAASVELYDSTQSIVLSSSIATSVFAPTSQAGAAFGSISTSGIASDVAAPWIKLTSGSGTVGWAQSSSWLAFASASAPTPTPINSFTFTSSDSDATVSGSNIIVTNGGGIGGTGVAISIVPEPSTYALIAGFAAFLFVAIRRRK